MVISTIPSLPRQEWPVSISVSATMVLFNVQSMFFTHGTVETWISEAMVHSWSLLCPGSNASISFPVVTFGL